MSRGPRLFGEQLLYDIRDIKLEKSMEIVEVEGDFIDVIPETSSADLSKVLISIDYGAPKAVNLVLPAFVSRGRHVLYLYPQSTELGKSITLLIGGDLRFYRFRQIITIGSDQSGLKYNLDLIANLRVVPSSTTLIPRQTIAPSGSAEKTDQPPSYVSALSVIVTASFTNNTSGLRILWLYSIDGSTFESDSEAIAKGNYYDINPASNTTKVTQVLIPILTPHVKVKLVNLDTAESVTADASYIYVR